MCGKELAELQEKKFGTEELCTVTVHTWEVSRHGWDGAFSGKSQAKGFTTQKGYRLWVTVARETGTNGLKILGRKEEGQAGDIEGSSMSEVGLEDGPVQCRGRHGVAAEGSEWMCAWVGRWDSLQEAQERWGGDQEAASGGYKDNGVCRCSLACRSCCG